MTSFFITSTGTEIGKTFVTAALAYQLREAGRAVDAVKPIMTGYARETMHESDAALLLRALGREVSEETIAEVSPFRFAAPLAPSMAARAEGREASVEALTAFCRERERMDRVLLIEGIGGVMVPIAGRQTVLDWIEAVAAPVILVTGSYLGTLSHTLTAIEVLRARRQKIAGIVVSESPRSTVSLADSVAQIRDLVELPVAFVPRIGGADAWKRVGGLTSFLELWP